jgi:hypothetical protein
MVVMGTGTYLNQSAENASLSGALDVSEGKNIFPDKTVFPFRLYTYTPLHAWLAGNLIKPFQNFPIMARVYLVRLFSLFCLFAIYIVLWRYYIKPIGSSFFIFFISVALSFSEMANYALTGRNDFLALFFEVLAGTLFLSWIRTKHSWFLALFPWVCVLSFLTRQNVLGMILGAEVYFLLKRDIKSMVRVGVSYTLVLGSSLAFILHYFPYFWDHSFRAHAVYWRPFYWTEPATLAFLICYSLFIVLTLISITKRQPSTVLQFVKIAVITSSIVPAIQIFRPGAWLNYFFEPILLSTCFCCLELTRINSLPHQNRYRKFVAVFMIIVSLITFSISALKAQKQWTLTAFLPYQEGAETIRKISPQGGIILGSLAQGLGVHLRDWEFLGPEILNGAHYGETNYSHFKWVYSELSNRIQSANPPALLYANPNCGEAKTAEPLLSDPYLIPLIKHFQLKDILYPWLCFYVAPKV